jgi:hypothetical protein|tara:strand:+ start:273 stop:497 length:225 start_codon:yes stop_codon:yes gene_type:complete
MLVKVTTKDGVISEHDTNAIKNKESRVQAEVLVRKVSTLEILREALQIANVVHRKNLEDIVAEAPESLVTPDEE